MRSDVRHEERQDYQTPEGSLSAIDTVARRDKTWSQEMMDWSEMEKDEIEVEFQKKKRSSCYMPNVA